MSKISLFLRSLSVSATLAVAAGSAGAQTLAKSDAAPVVIGSADFPESELLATIYAGALTAKGIPAETKLNIGSREV